MFGSTIEMNERQGDPSFLEGNRGQVEEKLRRIEEEIRRVEEEIPRVEEEIPRVEEEIRRVEEEIRRVEEDVRRVVAKMEDAHSAINSCSDSEKVIALQKGLLDLQQDKLVLVQKETALRQDKQAVRLKEHDLRLKEHDLRQDKHDLRQKELTLTSKLSDGGSSSHGQGQGFSDVMERLSEILRMLNAQKGGLERMSMSEVSTTVAVDILVKRVGFELHDLSASDPVKDVVPSEDWVFNMANYPREEDCYHDFFDHMVKYLREVHDVEIIGGRPGLMATRGKGCCKLLDVHSQQSALSFDVETKDGTRRIAGSLDAVFVPSKCGVYQYKDFMVGGVEVKHLPSHKDTFKNAGKGGGRTESKTTVPGQALMEALAVYALSDFSEGIFLLTSYDDNTVLELEDGEIRYWCGLNFAQAMGKIARFLKSEPVHKFLTEQEQPAKRRVQQIISEPKLAVRKKLKVGEQFSELFLEQLDGIRTSGDNKFRKLQDISDLVENWRSTLEDQHLGGITSLVGFENLSYFS